MRSMFDSATARLTFFYVVLLFTVSAFFSYNWYSVATAQLDINFEQQRIALERGRLRADRILIDEFLEARELEIRESKQAILGNIISANVLFLSIAGVGSYFLARRTLKPIEDAHEAQRRFTADASHELRTPIAAMQTEIEVTLRDKKLTKQDAVLQLESNLEELEKLRDLSSKLLLIARQDEDGDIELKPNDAKRISQKSIKRVEKMAKSKGIKLETGVAKATVNCDADSLNEILVILLENAIKYSPDKETVSLKGVANSEEYVFTVSDNGRGIKESDLTRIFERFYRADQSRNKTQVDGTGLGLSIAQNLAYKQGTKITVKSAGVDQGATFSFCLPLFS